MGAVYGTIPWGGRGVAGPGAYIRVCVCIYIYTYIHVVRGVYQPKYMSAGHHRVFLFRGMSSLWNSSLS